MERGHIRKARTVMTDRRREALAALAEYHYLTTSDFYRVLQIDDLHAERGVRRMLMLLHRAGLVERSRYAIDNPSDPFLRYQFCYQLARAGRDAIGRGEVAWEKSPASLAHELGITKFHIALARAVPETHKLFWRQTDLKRTVNPDALFALTDTTREGERSWYYYFLEVERSRQGHYRNGESGLLAKLRRYADYRRTERCRAEWQRFSDFRVVVVLANRERQENLLRVLRARLSKGFIWTVSTDDVERNATGAVFRAPPDYEQLTHSLISERNGGINV